MIIRKLILDHWRGVGHFEMDLEPGINLLLGRNEAGKSSIVEALDWALYRDIAGARLNLDEVRAIIPAGEPGAKPQVRVELEFFDCTATLTKILAEDSSRRECRLTIHRPGAADEHFDRTEAQRRLRSLFTADGLGAEKGNVAEASLLIAHQGEAASYLSDGSTAMRSTLGVASDGNLALTSRLERVRLQVETARRRELTQDLSAEAMNSARASTEAAAVREQLSEKNTELAHLEAVERELEDLRDEVAAIDSRISAAAKEEETARTQLEILNRLVVEQAEAEKLIAQAETKVKTAEAARDAVAGRAREIEHLRRDQSADEARLQECEAALTSARENLDAEGAASEAAVEVRERAEHEVEELKQTMEGWRAYAAVFDARELWRADGKALERLEGLRVARAEAEASVEGLGAVPSRSDLAQWRTQYSDLLRLETEAAQTLQIVVSPESTTTLHFERDGTAESITIPSGDTAALNAMTEAGLEIPGFGRIRIRSGARGAEDLRAAVATARSELEAQLAPWSASVSELDSVLANWDSQLAEREAAERELTTAREALSLAERQSGSIEELRQRVEARGVEFERAKAECEPYAHIISLGGRSRAEVKQAEEAARQALRDAESRAIRARNEYAGAQQRLRLAEAEWTRASRLPETLQAAMGSRSEQLERLEADGLTPEARAAEVESLSANLWSARRELEAAQNTRADLGNAVTPWQLEEARREHEVRSGALAADQKRVLELRRDIWHHSAEDAVARMEKLRAEIYELEALAQNHEARLRGLALLDAVLQVERSRLGRALAGPLNEKLAPWLSRLRGRETRIEFDESGSRIEAVGTVTATGSIDLPFKEHSEGMKEQIALALRLLLATRVAGHLPSKRLTVVLDDPFTQTDAERREGLASVLAEAGGSLQILMVSCHEEMIPESLVGKRTYLGEKPSAGEAREKVVKITRRKVTEEANLSLW